MKIRVFRDRALDRVRAWIINNQRKAAGTLTVLTILGFWTAASLMGRAAEPVHVQEGIAKEIIRFHVIANSDSEEDQALKLEVKDEMVDYLKGILEGADTVEAVKEAIEENLEIIEARAGEAVRSRGCGYQVRAEMTNCYFPVKTYGDCTFPAGYYDALRITIGKAEGKNWWCVLFPNLCFIDSIHGIVPEEEKEELKNVLTEDEYDSLFTKDKEYRIKWKFLNCNFLSMD